MVRGLEFSLEFGELELGIQGVGLQSSGFGV